MFTVEGAVGGVAVLLSYTRYLIGLPYPNSEHHPPSSILQMYPPQIPYNAPMRSAKDTIFQNLCYLWINMRRNYVLIDIIIMLALGGAALLMAQLVYSRPRMAVLQMNAPPGLLPAA